MLQRSNEEGESEESFPEDDCAGESLPRVHVGSLVRSSEEGGAVDLFPQE